MWGKRGAPRNIRHIHRSIPTGVGKTGIAAAAQSVPAVHPHGCGENDACHVPELAASGPSPRVWGKRFQFCRDTPKYRSIPTGVGKTRPPSSGQAGMTVHPHGCGENMELVKLPGLPAGPSPRVWGKRFSRACCSPCWRSIPTGVGKTVTGRHCYNVDSVHPHGCGENAAKRPCAAPAIGPSPRVWGKHPTTQCRPGRARSIPTGVGKTIAGMPADVLA